MGQCVARDLGFNVDRQTKDAALMKKMQEVTLLILLQSQLFPQ